MNEPTAPDPPPETDSAEVSALLADLGRLGLLEPPQLEELTQAFPDRSKSAKELGRELLRRDWLTSYQVNQLLKGRGPELLIGGYVVLARLGDGGMGQVFKARQRSLARIVALKVIRPDRLDNPNMVRRFQREVRAASRLDHAHIVRALDAGTDGTIHFMVMEHVEGSDLAKLVAKHGRLPVPAACEIIRQAALGLEYAHQQGLVHRDIKPSNLILVRSEGDAGFPVVKLLDLGLALQQQLTEEASTTLTDTGVVLGTPDFIAPEQITDSHNAGPAADLYSLGCTFYYLLAARPPFRGNTLGLKLVQQQLNEPKSIESVNPDVPAAVAHLVRRLMAKKPQERYPSAGALADALARILRTESWKPVQPFEGLRGEDEAIVRPLYEWKRPSGASRRLVLAGAAGLSAMGGGLALWLTWPNGRTPDGRDSTAEPPGTPVPSLDRLRRGDIPAEERFVWQPNELVRVLGEHRGRSWGPITSLAVSPDGTRLAACGSDRFVRLWDQELREVWALPHDSDVAGVAFVEGGKVLLSSSLRNGGRVFRWDVETGKPLGNPRKEAAGQWFSPDGKLLLDTLGRVRMFNAETGGSPLWSEAGITSVTLGAAFTPDGRGVFHGCADSSIRLRPTDGGPGKEIQRFVGHTKEVTSLACTRDGALLLSGSNDATVRLWDVKTGQELARHKLGVMVASLALSPADDLVLAVATTYPGALLELKRGEPGLRVRFPFGGLADSFSRAAFSPTGRQLFVASYWGEIRSWGLPVGNKPLREFVEPIAHPLLSCVALAPDGLRTFSGGLYGVRGRLWDTLTGKPLADLGDLEPHRVACALFSADGKRLFLGGSSGKVFEADGRTLELKRTLPCEPNVLSLALSPNGTQLAVGGGAETGPEPLNKKKCAVRLWDLQDEARSTTLEGHGSPVCGLTFTPDGRYLVTCSAGRSAKGENSVRLWDLKEKREVRKFLGQMYYLLSLSLSADGRYAAIGANLAVYLCDLQDGSGEPKRLLTDRVLLRGLFAPNGRHVYVAGSDGRVRVCTLQGNVVGEWQLPGAVHGLALTKSGDYLATANANGTVYILRLPAPAPAGKPRTP